MATVKLCIQSCASTVEDTEDDVKRVALKSNLGLNMEHSDTFQKRN